MATRANLFLCLATASVPLCAHAAEDTRDDRGLRAVEEIVVTAQRRSESLQNVPISISAIPQEQLAQRHIDSIEDIALVTPGLSFIDNGPGQGQFVMRGIQVAANSATEPRFQPSVGIYFDDVPVANALYNPSLNTFDMARVEVLRGPQGTLYGAGSLAGTVKFITNAPDASGFDAAIRAGGGKTENSPTNNYKGDVMLNVPLAPDVAALRFVGGYKRDGGYIDNVADGSRGWGQVTTSGGRIAFGYSPSERFSLTVRGIAQQQRANGDGRSDLESPGVSGPLSPLQQWRLTPTPVQDDFSSVSAEIQYDLGFAAFTSVSSYLDRDIKNRFDQTTIMPIFLPGAPLQFAPYDNLLRYNGVHQEIRLASTSPGPLKWIAGAYYSSSGKRFAQSWPTPGIDDFLISIGLPPSSAFGTEPNNVAQSLLRLQERQRAVFGELSYGFLDERLVASVGGRWFQFNQDYRVNAAGLYNGGVTAGAANAKNNGFNPKLVLSYRLSDRMLLAVQASEGFRLGGSNDVVPESICGAAAPLSFGPEHLRNYELSAKTSWLDERLIANVSFYEMHYKDMQLTQRFIPECGFSFTGNGGQATSRGVELELFGRVGENFQWSLFGSWIDASFDEDAPPGIGGFAGDRLPFSPRFSGSAYGRYSFPLGADLDAFVQLEYRYVGERIQRVDYKLDPTFDQPTPSYDIGNLQIGVKRNSWQATLYVDNVGNDQSILSGGGILFGLPAAGRRAYVNRPRTVGVEFSFYSR